MLGLQLPTDPRWAALAEGNLEELLTDHAFCEQKAASNAISIIVNYPEHSDLVREMTRIAQEELEHFAQVHARILERGWVLGRERKDAYVNQLAAFLRKSPKRTERLVERLLFAALVEARSCERFKLLAERVNDSELRTFYRELMVSEANHYTLFLGFARQFGVPEGLDVDARWREWLAYEAEIIQAFGVSETMHG